MKILSLAQRRPGKATALAGLAITLAAAGATDDRGRHLAAARAAASTDLTDQLALCGGPKKVDALYEAYAVRERVRIDPVQKPMRVFDNLYYVGTRQVSAWALDTPAGIVVIDALNAQDVDVITDGLSALGLDPAHIRYIIITHGHADHFGGARELQQRYGAHVIMGAKDWDLVEADWRKTRRTEPPRRDRAAPLYLRFGGTTIRMLPVPGHTPGNLSLLFPVTDRGRLHMVAYVSGLGSPRADPAGHYRSFEQFRDAAGRAGVDILLSNHPFNDMSLPKLRALEIRGPHDPNPFVVGKDRLRRLLTIWLECGRFVLANPKS